MSAAIHIALAGGFILTACIASAYVGYRLDKRQRGKKSS